MFLQNRRLLRPWKVSNSRKRDRMISVIVPVYKVEPYLRRCLDSIVGQTYGDLEILLIDDGSPDRCGEICDEYARTDGRVRVFHTENRGVSAARNLGLKEATGEYIGFVDPDDRIEPDMYDILFRRLEETGADISMCGVLREYSSFVRTQAFEDTLYTGEEALTAWLDRKLNSEVWNRLYRKELLENISFPEEKTYEDISFSLETLAASRSVAMTRALEYHYRHRPGSITKSHTAKNLLDYADAHLSRYAFLREHSGKLFREKEEDLLWCCAVSISKLWRWWYACGKTEKRENREKIEELKQFSQEHFPLFGRREWKLCLRVSCLFMRSSSQLSFACLYCMSQTYRRLRGL